jgi:LL-diaminopimelate aminotransferase
LQVKGAKDVAVEFNSLSKAYNLAGWRLGMACGNKQIVGLLENIKSHVDTSTFLPIYEGGIAALTGDQNWLNERNDIYQRRRNIVLAALQSIGFSASTPLAAFYVWAKLPEGYPDAYRFCDDLLDNTGVSVTPGDIYGEHGRGFIRISLGMSTDRIEKAMQKMVDWVKGQNRETHPGDL